MIPPIKLHRSSNNIDIYYRYPIFRISAGHYSISQLKQTSGIMSYRPFCEIIWYNCISALREFSIVQLHHNSILLFQKELVNHVNLLFKFLFVIDNLLLSMVIIYYRLYLFLLYPTIISIKIHSHIHIYIYM